MGAFIMYLVDTNILIYYFNGDIPEESKNKINKILKEHFNISVITKMEFLGFRKHTAESFKKAKNFLDYSTVYNLSDEIIDLVIDIRRSNNIKLPDAIIAATTIINKLTLVTRNTNDFKNIKIDIYNPFENKMYGTTRSTVSMITSVTFLLSPSDCSAGWADKEKIRTSHRNTAVHDSMVIVLLFIKSSTLRFSLSNLYQIIKKITP
jgi:hypothetical protein